MLVIMIWPGSNETEKDFDPNRESLSLRCPFQFVHVKSKSENLWCLRKLGGLILVKYFIRSNKSLVVINR